MLPCLRPFCWLCLLLVSCDKQPETSQNTDHGAKSEALPKITKSARTPRVEIPEVREKFHVSLDEANRISSPAERDKAVAEIVWNHLELDSSLALEAFQQLTPGSPERVRLIQHFAMRLAERDIEAAIKWAGTLENPEEISLAYGRISLVLAETDPARAANLISESGMAGREFDVAVVQVIQRWAANAPADAAAWVILFDPGQARTAGIETVVALWAESDMPATLTWIASLQNETLLQEARAAMAAAILQQPSETQTEWLKRTPPEIRAEFEKMKAQADKEAAD